MAGNGHVLTDRRCSNGPRRRQLLSLSNWRRSSVYPQQTVISFFSPSSLGLNINRRDAWSTDIEKNAAVQQWAVLLPVKLAPILGFLIFFVPGCRSRFWCQTSHVVRGARQSRWVPIHKPGSRHCHLAIGHCTVRQLVFDCKYMSCKICFNVLNYVFILFIFNIYCLVNIQHCYNSSHCDWQHHI